MKQEKNVPRPVRFRSPGFKKFACAAVLAMAAQTAQSAPTTFNFTTAPGPYSSSGVTGLFSATDVVSGSFVYDPDSPQTGTGGTGTTIYGNAAGTVASFSSLTGTVAGYSFSDPRGYVTVGNDVPVVGGTASPLDQVILYADSSLASGVHNFSGFTLSGYTLVNVRIFWIESQDIPDFLSDQILPPAPPTFMARLSLDFVSNDNPNLPATAFVFFNGVKVTPATPPACP